MDIYPTIPYTYKLKWSITGMMYYGVRYASNCNPSDLWVTYFTSSKHVHKYIELYGPPDIIEVRKIFNGDDNITLARNWEHTVLRRLNAATRPDYLNKSNGKGIPPMVGDNNPMRNKQVKEKHLSVVTTDSHRLYQSVKVKERVTNGTHHFLGDKINKTRVQNGTHQFLGGKIQGITSRRRVNDGTHNFLHETKKQLENGTHQSQKHWVCEYCNKDGYGTTNYKRWHGVNCKSRFMDKI